MVTRALQISLLIRTGRCTVRVYDEDLTPADLSDPNISSASVRVPAS